MAEENAQQKALFTIRQRIDEQTYEDFNFLMVEDMVKNKKRQVKVLGIIEIVIGVLFLLVTLFSQERANWVYSLLAAVLILLGIYGMLFYRYVFPGRLKKAAKKQYAGNPYLQNEVEFRFFEDAFREISAETDNTVDWEEVQRILYTDHLIVLMLANRRCVIIPRTSIRNFDTEFLKYLERQIHHHEITALHKESAAR